MNDIEVHTIDENCVLTFEVGKLVLSYDQAFDLAVKLLKFVESSDLEQGASLEADSRF